MEVSVTGRRHGQGDQRQRGRQGLRGQPDPAARSRRRHRARGVAAAAEAAQPVSAASAGASSTAADGVGCRRRAAGASRTHRLWSGSSPARSASTSKVKASGRKGRILREDVTAYFKSTQAPAPAAAAAASGGNGIADPEGRLLEVRPGRGRRDAADQEDSSGPALHRSWLNVPPARYNEEAGLTEIDKHRKELAPRRRRKGYRVTTYWMRAKRVGNEYGKVNSSIHPTAKC